VAIRGNVFLNWQGGKESFIGIGNDGKPYHEAKHVWINNNLMIGNSLADVAALDKQAVIGLLVVPARGERIGGQIQIQGAEHVGTLDQTLLCPLVRAEFVISGSILIGVSYRASRGQIGQPAKELADLPGGIELLGLGNMVDCHTTVLSSDAVRTRDVARPAPRAVCRRAG
jgi:hypothetical protein